MLKEQLQELETTTRQSQQALQEELDKVYRVLLRFQPTSLVLDLLTVNLASLILASVDVINFFVSQERG